MAAVTSPFLSPGLSTTENQLASLHLRRDQTIPTILSSKITSDDATGYAEGNVVNTRFGSFPHSTLLNVPWGSQVRASRVDTGTRGRQGQHAGHKRKANALADRDDGELKQPKEAVTADTGFLHVLPPTPESWTTSLPHRTQVVYTPDYSYILHRIRAVPGKTLVEAGSGSGSFTHAAARAVFNGYDEQLSHENDLDPAGTGSTKAAASRRGKVFTYEFHEERHQKVALEMEQHGLKSIVHATHRDVYREGFLLSACAGDTSTSPRASAIFLDLPAPWEALPHLTRRSEDGRPSALDPDAAVHICTFSPCIEQVQRTVSALRQHSWMDIETVEMQHKRIEVQREYTGLEYDGMRGVNSVAASVEDAVNRLREVEQRAKDYHSGAAVAVNESKQARVARSQMEARKTFWRDGRVIHRSEPELRTHTSYLVFATLPREWSQEDEEMAQTQRADTFATPANVPKSQRQLKKEARLRNKVKQRTKAEQTNGVEPLVPKLEQTEEDGDF